MRGSSRFEAVLVLIFAAWWCLMAVSPNHRADWALENVLSVVAVVVLAATHRSFRLSKVSYFLIFVFGCLHTLGAHYTYAEVPYQEVIQSTFGESVASFFQSDRNHYDRFVHFMYGLLLAYPIREVFLRIASARGFWGYFLPLDLTMSSSMLYELVEWAVAGLFGGDLGMAYLGTQGDVWDAHKDMALASLGALLAMLITLAINYTLQRDFAREWSESLRIKRTEPLGEIEVARMLDDA